MRARIGVSVGLYKLEVREPHLAEFGA